MAVLLLVAAPTASAYIDPGSGLLLVQGLISVIVGGLFVARRALWRLLGRFRQPAIPAADDPPPGQPQHSTKTR